MNPASAMPQFVTPTSGGALWLTGSEGFALFFDGQRAERRDYPARPGAQPHDYEYASDIPVARVVLLDNDTLLFTRPGDVLRWERGRWERLEVRLPGEGGPAQLDAALVMPDRTLVLQVHSHTLLFTDRDGLGAGRFRAERTPSYLTWLGVFDGLLYGLGFDESGQGRAAWRRESSGRWTVLARLPPEERVGSYRALLRTVPFGFAAVTTRGFVPLSTQQGEPELRPATSLSLRNFSRASAAPVAIEHLYGGLNVGPRSAALFTGGNGNHAVLIDPEHNWAHPCGQGTSLLVGAVLLPQGGLRLVTNQGAVVDSTAEGCAVRAPPIVNR